MTSRGRGIPVQITGARLTGKGSNYIAYVFVYLSSIVICLLHKLTLSVQAQVALQLRVSLADLV